jgi:hypothetical protein
MKSADKTRLINSLKRIIDRGCYTTEDQEKMVEIKNAQINKNIESESIKKALVKHQTSLSEYELSLFYRLYEITKKIAELLTEQKNLIDFYAEVGGDFRNETLKEYNGKHKTLQEDIRASNKFAIKHGLKTFEEYCAKSN